MRFPIIVEAQCHAFNTYGLWIENDSYRKLEWATRGYPL